jgi:muconolactone delta-isomerase
VTTYLAELYQQRLGARDLEGQTVRAQVAAQDSSADGRRVRLLRSIFVPGDETCFQLFEAASAEDVEQVLSQAGLAVERIVEVVEVGAATDPAIASRTVARSRRAESSGR